MQLTPGIQFSTKTQTINWDQDKTDDIAPPQIPGFEQKISDDGKLLSLEWKDSESYSPEAIEKLSKQIKDLPVSIRLTVKSDIFSENKENAAHFFAHLGTRVMDLVVIGGIWSAPLTDEVIQKLLKSCPQVQTVDCSWGDGITGEFISCLPPTVRELSIGKCRTLLEKHLSALKNCEGLEAFTLQNYISREDEFFGLSTPTISGDFLQYLPRSLRALTLIQYEFDEKKLASLGRLENLKNLTMEYCIYWKGAFIEFLNRGLESLNLTACTRIEGKNLEHLAGFKNLRKLCYPKALAETSEELSFKLPNCKFIEARF